MQIAGLMKELGGAGAAELGIQLDDGFVDRLLAYARSVASFPTAVKEVTRFRLIINLHKLAAPCHF